MTRLETEKDVRDRVIELTGVDGTGGAGLDADLVAQNVGILDIRSVYDVDGVDTAVPDIATLADPAQTVAADRPARRRNPHSRRSKIIGSAQQAFLRNR